jgi:PleD family two-component response regulator
MQNDSLTGLPDRALFRDRLEQAISTWTDASTSRIISAMLSATICCGIACFAGRPETIAEP